MKITHIAHNVIKGVQQTAEVAATLKSFYDAGKYVYTAARAAAPVVAAVAAAL